MKTLNLSKDSLFLLVKRNWHIILLSLIAILSFWFNFYNISNYGYGNEYYAAAIRSMTQSFKNFFFVSFDPAGMVTIDKPPFGFWMQAISVLIFGYHGWAMLLPQALAGTASCVMLYILVSKHFGKAAGLISSFIFSFTPVVVAVSRNNTIDMQLIFMLLLAAYFLFKSLDSGKKRYLFIAGALIGVGFNIKMLQAYLALPAFVLVYLFFAKEKLLKRFLSGAIALVIMFGVSFSWVAAVELYPSDKRPYVDSSSENSVLELIIGHNGLERLYGRNRGGSGSSKNGGNTPGGAPNRQNGAQHGQPNTRPNDATETKPLSSSTGDISLVQLAATPNPENRSEKGSMTGDESSDSLPQDKGMPPNITENGQMPNNPPQGGQMPPDMAENGQMPNNPPQDGIAPPDIDNSNGSIQPSTSSESIEAATDNSQYQTSASTAMPALENGTVSSQTPENTVPMQGQRGAPGDGQNSSRPSGNGATGDDIGNRSLLRMWVKSMYGQTSWLLILAFLSVLVYLKKINIKELSTKHGVFVFFTLWLATMFFFFSFAGYFHRYYLCMFAPGIAALCGMGIVKMGKEFKDKTSIKQFVMPAALIATLAIQIPYVYAYSQLRTWLVPVMAAFGAAALILMGISYLKKKNTFVYAAAILMGVSILCAPFYWALTPVLSVPTNFTMPAADPNLLSNSKTVDVSKTKTSSLEEYLVANYKEGSFLVVGNRANDVAKYIIDTGLPAYAYGGFMGKDNSLTLDKLKEYVAEGKITYFLVSNGGMGTPGGGENGSGGNSITEYVKANARFIDPSEYNGTSSSNMKGGVEEIGKQGFETGGSLYLFE
ncbi:MAG: glycosyltransferase family 39 protein [Clostridia bacterium]|nr:glycosyltransferase family 39 protein [Clostridia bacterium]